MKKISKLLAENRDTASRLFALIGHTHDDYPPSYADTAARDAITGDARYEGVIAYVVSDQTTYQLRGGSTNADWVTLVTAIGGTSHTMLADIGTTSHVDIDTHIANAALHFTQAAISITESQISDLQAYALSTELATHAHTIGQITGFTNNSTNWDLAYGWGNHAVAGYLTSYTVTQGDVTAHQAALSITESQISDLQTYSVSTHNHDGAYIIPTSGVATYIPVFTAAAAAIGTAIFTWDGAIFAADKFKLNNTLDRLTIGDGTVAVPGLEINATVAGDPYINLQQLGVTYTTLKFDDTANRTEISSLADDITLRPGNVDAVTITQALATFAGDISCAAFTSTGIDDNATGVHLTVGDDLINFGDGGISVTLANNSVSTQLDITGGNVQGNGGHIVLHGSGHASTGDLYMGSGGAGNYFMVWDESLGSLVFKTTSGSKVPALTLDSSQNATFAGNIALSGASSPELTITDTTNTVTARVIATDTNVRIGSTTAHGVDIQTAGTSALTLDASQNSTFAGDAIFTNGEIRGAAATFSIHTTTSDAADNARVTLCGGGAAASTRGALIQLYGNEQGSLPGRLLLDAGNVSGGVILLRTGASVTALTIDTSQNATFAGDVTVDEGITGSPVFRWRQNGGNRAFLQYNDTGDELRMQTDAASGDITFYPANALALTLNTSQNAIFAGDVTAGGITLDNSADRVIVGDGTNSSAAIRIDSAATGNPFVQWEQASIAKAYIQYADSGDHFNLFSDGTVRFHPNNTLALTLDTAGDATFVGTIISPAATTALASARIPHGAAPTTPTDGDMWTTTAGLYVRISGVTVGPLT